MEKYLEVRGGYMSGGEKSDDSSNKATSGVFMEKKSVVVRESEIGSLFRRDWELCGMPKIFIARTNKRPYR